MLDLADEKSSSPKYNLVVLKKQTTKAWQRIKTHFASSSKQRAQRSPVLSVTETNKQLLQASKTL